MVPTTIVGDADHTNKEAQANGIPSDESVLNIIPFEIWQEILLRACEGNNPLPVSLICKDFYKFIYGQDFVAKQENEISLIPYSNLNRFMQSCYKSWWTNLDSKRYNAGILELTQVGYEAVNFSFAELDQTNGIFALPLDLAPQLRIMRNVEEFLKTGGDNEDKALVLFVLLSEAEKAARLLEKSHPFVKAVMNWDISQAAAGVFMRYGSDNVNEWGVAHLVVKKFAVLPKSLIEIWKNSSVCSGTRQLPAQILRYRVAGAGLHLFSPWTFRFEENKDFP